MLLWRLGISNLTTLRDVPLGADDRQFLKELYQELDVWPLPAGDPLYQPVYEHEGSGCARDLKNQATSFYMRTRWSI
jgi:hypothetical protein